MTLNTSPERVDSLITQSTHIYETIDPLFDGEPRYRRMLRAGVNAAAIALRDGETIENVGQQLLELPATLPRHPGPLDPLADAYADIRRATLDQNNDNESDARHAIHLMKLSHPYAKDMYPHLHTGRIAAYALVHDIIEAYAGDVASLGMTPEQATQKHRSEAAALVTLREEYGKAWPEFVELIETYEALADSEARFVKTFDKLDPGFTQFHNNGIQLKAFYGLSRQSFFQAIGQTTERMNAYSSEFPKLMQDREELTRQVAAVAFKEAA